MLVIVKIKKKARIVSVTLWHNEYVQLDKTNLAILIINNNIIVLLY